MNQILTTEKLYVTPEMKKKKIIYKLEFFLSVFLICLLFSYYIYAEYDRNKSEQVSQEILADLQYKEDDTIKQAEDDVIIVVLNEPEENKPTVITKPAIDTKVYKSKDGIKYTTAAILKIPKINLEYPILSKTSPELLYVSLNYYWGPKGEEEGAAYYANEVGNYCIVGHYYSNGKMFGKLHKLQNGDIAELTDNSGRTIQYKVYNQYIVEPTDTRCTSQLTNGQRELTLITCTNHGKQRLIVKLREV